MRLKSLTIICLCACQIALGQDTLRLETTQDSTFKTPQYVDAFDDLFSSQKETKWLFKLDWMPFFNKTTSLIRDVGLTMEFERKIAKNVSINTGLFMDRKLCFQSNQIFQKSSSVSLAIETRWFLNNRKRNLSNNLNGYYLSLGGTISKYLFIYNNTLQTRYSPKILFDQYEISLNYGLQKRIFKNWYVNYHIGLNYLNQDNLPKDWPYDRRQLGMQAQFAFGTAFGGGKSSKYETCDVFRCFQEEKTLLKLDIRWLLETLKKNDVLTQMMVGYETKLNNSAWSLNMEVKPLLYWYNNQVHTKYIDKIISVHVGLEPRYYYNLKKRIARGKSANNLSGNYLSLATYFTHEKKTYKNFSTWQNPDFARQSYERNYVTIAPKIGLQRRLFKRGFADISLAPWQLNYGNINPKGKYVIVNNNSIPVFDTKIGFAF